jgi:hypothetical protein
MTKEQLIERQIYVRQRETELHLETQKLLFDILSSMTTEQKDKLKGYAINDDYTISGNVTNDSFDVVEYDGNIFTIDVDNCYQPDQKELIDFILENNLVN